MTEERLKQLLREADRDAGSPAPVLVDISTVRRKANFGHRVFSKVPLAAAAVLLIAVGIWYLPITKTEMTERQVQIDSLESQIKQLQASTDAAINLIHEVLEQEQRQSRLDKLQVRLASIPDPLEEMSKQVDKTAFILVYQADRLYRELNQTDSAVETYKRVIKLFPENQLAQVARERLNEIERKSKNDSSKGDSKWKLQSV
jgi:tetratricopeptide (TPR) repeat protein